ncbi:hypothetical protein K439DRAFT_1635922 [Ramaria rubella]|nr:hypothetical protein K439DRAFT_1635922 [Ramaria rubella]
MSSLVMKSVAQMHSPRSRQEPERGRSRTPKATPIGLGGSSSRGHSRHSTSVELLTTSKSVQRRVMHRPPPLRRRPPPKGESPDRSQPGALEDAIREAHGRGDLRQCLQWVLELQGVYLDWDDPRLDTVTEDDLCFAECAGMGPDATQEERARAEQYWEAKKAEEEESRRVWELTATPKDREMSRRIRGQIEAEQQRRDARAQYFRAPRQGKPPTHPLQPQRSKPTFSRFLDYLDSPLSQPPLHSRPDFLFPMDESELHAMRSMWLDQGRKGLAIVENLVRPPEDPTGGFVSSTKTDICPEHSEDAFCDSCSTSPSSSSSAPSALFSSILTETSTATSISTVTRANLLHSPTKVPPARTTRSVTPAPGACKFISVPSTECPLHTHAAVVSLRKLLEEEYTNRTQMRRPASLVSHRTLTTSETRWLRKGSKAVEGFVDLISKLPTSYLPSPDYEDYSPRFSSCPPPYRPSRVPESFPETYIYLLPLRSPSYPRVFPPIPTLPRSPHRPIVPPAQVTPRMRLVGNPQYLRLKALQNRVLWGLVSIPEAECDMLADIARRHSADAPPGRMDVDRQGYMFTAREVLLRVAVEGLGKSALRTDLSARDDVSALAALWTWWHARL